MRILSRFVLLFAILAGVFGASPAAAAEPTPQPAKSEMASQIFLPIIRRAPPFTLSGQVTTANGAPLSGVNIDAGVAATLTASDGSYNLGLESGPLAVAPYKEGYTFDPPMIDLNLNRSLVDQDFTALTACTEKVGNNGFETGGWWNMMEGAGLYPAVYTAAAAHSGSRSGRVGIVNPAERPVNPSGLDSRLRTQAITINPGTSATLRLWLYPVSTEVVAKPPSALNDAPADAPANDDLSTTAFGDATMAADVQYVRLLNAADAQIATLLQIRSNNAYWSLHQFDLSAYAGQTVKVEVGVYNDAYDGVTALYVDDVSLSVCGSAPPPPPPPPPGPCFNRVANGQFEYNGSWSIPSTAYPAGYSYDYYTSASRSMRTGIPLVSGSGNAYSYSDAWQDVALPAGSSATLRMRLFARSEEPTAMALSEEDLAKAPDVDANAPKFAEDQVWGDKALSPEAADAQYVLILNPSTGAVLQTLLWWSPRNAAGWQLREFDLNSYAGRTIRLQFGTFNNGSGGRSVMYVDDVEVNTCGSTPPPPPPPPTCLERISNGGFENNNAWYIPQTNFSAGYSTFLRHSGSRSMRTGIYYDYHNRYSYSDVRQTVSIPAGYNTATLRFWGYQMTTPYALSKENDLALAASLAPTSPLLGMEAVSGDVQYVLVLDQWGNWIDTLVWERVNAPYWRQWQINLNRFRGQTIMLQFGAYNNGSGGVTSFYVDDVSLLACP